METIKGEQTLTEQAERFQVHPNQIAEWKKQLLDRASETFDKGKPSRESEREGDSYVTNLSEAMHTGLFWLR